MTDKQRLDELFQKALREIEGDSRPVALIDPYDLPKRAEGYRLVIGKGERGYFGKIVAEDIGVILESNGHDSKASAAHEALRDFRVTNPQDAAKLTRALDANLDAWFEAKNALDKPTPQIKISKVPAGFRSQGIVGSMVSASRIKHGKGNALTILGDPMYLQEFKMPKWNRKVTILDTPDVAIKHWHTLGIPTSKGAHRQRADHFRDLKNKFQKEHERLVTLAEKLYGAQGGLISGGLRDHWPDQIKDPIRFLAHGITTLSEAVHLHDALSKTRSPSFK
jgi:hypothetical protein